jgi:hypothetical protein
MLPVNVLAFALIAAPAAASPQVRVVAGVEVIPLLSAKEFPSGAIAAADVTATRVLVASGSTVTDVSGKTVMKLTSPISDVATVGEEILVVAGNQLHFASSTGIRTGAVKLPATGMRLAMAAGDRTVYLYGGAKGAVYRYGAGGAYVDLFRVEEPITALAVAGDRIVFATGGDLFTWKSGEDAILVARLPDGIVNSLAIDGRAGIVYGSTPEIVFAVSDGSIIPVLQGVGGELALVGSGLTVLDGARRVFLGISGIEKLLGAEARP